MRTITLFVVVLLSAAVANASGSLDKAKSLRSNGLQDEAKKELVELLFEPTGTDDSKAEALLLLGDIAVDEKKVAAARENWNKLISTYPATPFAQSARDKLEVLQQLTLDNPSPAATAPSYAPGTTLVVGPPKYAWAAPQIAAAMKPPCVAFGGTLADAIAAAAADPNISALVEVSLAVDIAFEWGRVTCYRPAGTRVWDKTVRVTYPGSEEAIARRFVDKLAGKVKGKACP